MFFLYIYFFNLTRIKHLLSSTLPPPTKNQNGLMPELSAFYMLIMCSNANFSAQTV